MKKLSLNLKLMEKLPRGRRMLFPSRTQVTHFIAMSWVWPFTFLAILIYANIGPVLWLMGLVDQKFPFLCPEYINAGTFYFSCGFGVFILGYYSKWSYRLSYRLPIFVLKVRTLSRFRIILYLLLVVALVCLVSGSIENLWSSNVQRGYGQFEKWTPIQFLGLVPLFTMPIVSFISGFFSGRFPGFSRILAGTFVVAALNLLALQSRGIFIAVLIMYVIGRFLGHPEQRWRNFWIISIACLLSINALQVIGGGRSMSPGIGIYNTYKGVQAYLAQKNLYKESDIHIFPESGDLHYLTKVMALNSQKSYMPLDEFLLQVDPLPSFLGRYFYWQEGGWFTKAVGCWGSAGTPLPFGAVAYAGLGFWGILFFLPVGIVFRLFQIQFSDWETKHLDQRILNFVTPLFGAVLIIATLVSFSHGGIRTWIRFLINFWLFILMLKMIGVVTIDS